MDFVKYEGLGNDFILMLSQTLDVGEVKRMCDRHRGIGADGIILITNPNPPTNQLPPNEEDSPSHCSVRILNSDGSEAEMCGNGIRCVAAYLAQRRRSLGPFNIATLSGLIRCWMNADETITVRMGIPLYTAAAIPTTLAPPTQPTCHLPLSLPDGSEWRVSCVSMGNPHCICFVPSLEDIALEQLGPLFERHPAFPNKTNVEFVEVLSAKELRVLVWERGAGRTMACGTGACAVLVAGVLNGRSERSAQVHLPGGTLHIFWDEKDNAVYMTGPAKKVFEGQYPYQPH